VRPGRFELPTLCLEGRRSIRLSYGRVDFCHCITELEASDRTLREAAGLIRKAGRGKYEKLGAIANPENGEVAEGRVEVPRPVEDSPSVPTEEGLKNAL
jgi:hypothetical protein